MAFEAATSTGPTTLHVDIMPDAIALLPKGGQDRLRKLRLRFNDLNKLIPKFEDTHAATMARVEAEQRLARLRRVAASAWLIPTSVSSPQHSA
jgi:hypothetical protein